MSISDFPNHMRRTKLNFPATLLTLGLKAKVLEGTAQVSHVRPLCGLGKINGYLLPGRLHFYLSGKENVAHSEEKAEILPLRFYHRRCFQYTTCPRIFYCD